MARFPTYLTPPMLARLRGLRLRPRRVVEGSVAGLHRSPWRGFSIEFAEHREYTAGDDLRHLDWKLLGRTDRYYLKQYEDETRLVCYLVVDVSESMLYRGTGSQGSKLDYARQLAAMLAHLVLEQHGGVGLATFDARLRAFVRPGSTAGQWDQIVTALDTSVGPDRTSAGTVFHELAERCTQRGVVVLFTDAFDDVPAMLRGLGHFTYRGHDVVLFHVLDPAELTFPLQGAVDFQGLENHPHIQADASAVRQAYLQEMESYLRTFTAGCQGLGVEYRRAVTGTPAEILLATWLAERMARGAA